jgi:transcriptional regulator with XRE-family HTH domain
MKSPTKLISMPKVAARLRLTRQALKLSQAGLCRIARISPQAWNNAETGDNLIGLETR